MRMFPKGLRDKIQSLKSSVSWLTTMTGSSMKWGIPNSEFKVLGERVNLMSKTLEDIYRRLNKYDIS
jgi:nitrate/nitrite-specific signal transduction histidine kinase